MSLAALLEELEEHTAKVRDELSHLVSWQKFQRAAAVVTELEAELQTLGLPMAPVEAVTQGLIGVVTAVHSHLTADQTAATRAELEQQLADVQAKLAATPTAPAPAPAGPLVDVAKLQAEVDARAAAAAAAAPTFVEPSTEGSTGGEGGAAGGGKKG